MTKKIHLLVPFMVVMLFASFAQAQDEAFYKRPGHGSELSVNLGHMMYHGDVYVRPGFGAGVSFRRAFDYMFSWRVNATYGQTYGFDTKATRVSGMAGYPNGTPFYRNFKSSYYAGEAQLVINFGNVLFNKPSTKWSFLAFAGSGIYAASTKIDRVGSNGAPYDYTGIDNENYFTTLADLKDIHDGDYETNTPYPRGTFNILRTFDADADDVLSFQLNGGFGTAYKINERFSLGLEHQISVPFNDFLDGYRAGSTGSDLVHWTNVKANFVIGPNAPLWWVNPLTDPLEDLAEVKARSAFDPTDSDGDGVIDMVDQEKDSPAGAPVDTRGVTLDSDKDGVADYKDVEPYSPPGFQIDGSGKALVPEVKTLTEADVKSIGRTEGWYNSGGGSGTLTDWFLPMIHFDLNKYAIKAESAEDIYHVATVMQLNPGIRVVVKGHADNLGGDDYNRVLSYKRAEAVVNYLVKEYNVSRDRLVIQYGGEEQNLVPANGNNYMNRRVEFRVAKGGDTDMGRPTGPDAGSGNGGINKAGY